MKAIAKINLCDDIRKDDEVEVVPEYGYVLGIEDRVKDFFKVKSGEVVVKKIIKDVEGKSSFSVMKCDRKDLDFSKK